MKKLKNIPHLFAKVTVIYCVAFATFASLCALYIQARGGAPAELLAVILAFFGGELLLLCLKTILKREKPPDAATDAATEEYNDMMMEGLE